MLKYMTGRLVERPCEVRGGSLVFYQDAGFQDVEQKVWYRPKKTAVFFLRSPRGQDERQHHCPTIFHDQMPGSNLAFNQGRALEFETC